MEQEKDLVGRLKGMRGLIPVKDVAAELGVTKQKIYEMAATGKLPHVRVGGALRFDPVLLARWVTQHSA